MMEDQATISYVMIPQMLLDGGWILKISRTAQAVFLVALGEIRPEPRMVWEPIGWVELAPGQFLLSERELASKAAVKDLRTLQPALKELGPEGVKFFGWKKASGHQNAKTVFTLTSPEVFQKPKRNASSLKKAVKKAAGGDSSNPTEAGSKPVDGVVTITTPSADGMGMITTPSGYGVVTITTPSADGMGMITTPNYAQVPTPALATEQEQEQEREQERELSAGGRVPPVRGEPLTSGLPSLSGQKQDQPLPAAEAPAVNVNPEPVQPAAPELEEVRVEIEDLPAEAWEGAPTEMPEGGSVVPGPSVPIGEQTWQDINLGCRNASLGYGKKGPDPEPEICRDSYGRIDVASAMAHKRWRQANPKPVEPDYTVDPLDTVKPYMANKRAELEAKRNGS